MRYYVGLGNAGCKMLRRLSTRLIEDTPPGRAPATPAHFVFGDADANNNVISTLLDKATQAGFATGVFELDLFWSGGCGVYHLIGELIADQALATGLYQLFGDGVNNPLFALFAGGGGTGGGSTTALEVFVHSAPRPPGRMVRLFVALPELDRLGVAGQPVSLEIHGPDDFQCAAAGRFLVQYLARAFLAVPENAPPQRQLFLLSNSWLATVANVASVPRAVRRLNQFLSAFVLLMDDDIGAYPIQNRGQNQLVTFGLGVAGSPPTAPDKPPVTPDIPTLAARLVATALGPLDIHSADERTPTGISALPMPAQLYADSPTVTGALSELLAGAPPLSPAAVALRAALHACPSVQVQLVYRTPEIATQLAQAGLQDAVIALLVPLFGINRPITVTSLTPANAAAWFNRHPPTQFPVLAADQPADVAALVFLGNLVVEDVWRLINYYLQSSFPWQTPSRDVIPVGNQLRDLLLTLPVRSNALPAAPDAARVAAWKAYATQFVVALTDPTAPVWLPPNSVEVYAEQFWGNFEQLRLKVLQNLEQTPEHFDQKKLTVDHVARALAMLSMQIRGG